MSVVVDYCSHYFGTSVFYIMSSSCRLILLLELASLYTNNKAYSRNFGQLLAKAQNVRVLNDQ